MKNRKFNPEKSMRNSHGIVINKCCGSCQFRTLEKDGKRICLLLHASVRRMQVCEEWRMSEGMKNAGKCDGRLKRSDYLKFVLNFRVQEQEAIERGEKTLEQQVTVRELRRMFTKKCGVSPYMVF